MYRQNQPRGARAGNGPGAFFQLSDVLPALLAKQPGHHRLSELRVESAFRDLLGEPLAASCEMVRLRGRVLMVMTSNPALAHQLRLDSATVLSRLNDQGLGVVLSALQVRTGRPGFLRELE